jgi:hypothetical protein
MTKFKILKWALLLFIIGNLAAIAINLKLIYDYRYDIGKPIPPPGLILKLSYYIAITMLFTSGLYYIYRSCAMFVSRGYFNGKSAFYLKRGAYILIATVLVRLVITAVNTDDSTFDKDLGLKDFLSGMSSNITLIIIAFSLIAVSDIVKKGSKLKEENDLTI